jgi:hypothetical protein
MLALGVIEQKVIHLTQGDGEDFLVQENLWWYQQRISRRLESMRAQAARSSCSKTRKFMDLEGISTVPLLVKRKTEESRNE